MLQRLLLVTPPIAARTTRHWALPWPVIFLVAVPATHCMARGPRTEARMTTCARDEKMK